MQQILKLTVSGLPQARLTLEEAVLYYATGQVLWEAGTEIAALHGGHNAITGLRSEVRVNSIIAIRGKALAIKGFNQVPPLNNRELFNRDRFMCAFCGGDFSHYRLTCDHILPMSRGGRDSWMNVVTACRACNQKKGSRTPEEAHMQLLYAPYVPNRAEFLILANRRILADQMEFLRQHVSANSRVREGAHAGRYPASLS